MCKTVVKNLNTQKEEPMDEKSNRESLSNTWDFLKVKFLFRKVHLSLSVVTKIALEKLNKMGTHGCNCKIFVHKYKYRRMSLKENLILPHETWKAEDFFYASTSQLYYRTSSLRIYDIENSSLIADLNSLENNVFKV